MVKNRLPKSAGGWGAIWYSLKQAQRAGGLFPMLKALYTKNACKSCALGMGGQRGGFRNEKGNFPEVCNKSFLAQASDMQGGLPDDFFDKNDIKTLKSWSPRELELSGRLVHPLLSEEGDSHYKIISWDQAIDLVTEKLKAVSPDRTFFYSSGRSSNEAGFILQLFARLFGTNNINNCSYYCHQASGVGLSQSLGTGTATLELEDLDQADLIFLIGANPASNHPRFMTTLMKTRRRGGKVIVVNPAKERGLENFSVPSDIKSLLFGSEIASTYIQPHIGGDSALFKGIAKALFQMDDEKRGVIDHSFIKNSSENFSDFQKDVRETSWETIVSVSGVSKEIIEDAARQYAEAENVVMAWAMGVTHHAHGVENVQSIANLALLRGMVGRKNAGLLPLRGHSNVQGIGSIGVTPQLKQAVFDNLESAFDITLPSQKGLDTLSCMENAQRGEIDFAWNLGGNLYGSNPDSQFAEEALSKIDFALYMNTTLNQGHFRGKGKTTLILPVLARDEEPEPTTQESMFSYIRLSEGGPNRHFVPRSEIRIIADIAGKVLGPGPIIWEDLNHPDNIRQIIGQVIPGFEKIKDIDTTGKEFHIQGRILHKPEFPRPNGKALFRVCPLPQKGPDSDKEKNHFKLMTVRSEGQFNTVVYDLEDKYRGVPSRDVVLMNPEDIQIAGLNENGRVRVFNDTGKITNLTLFAYDIRRGNIMMYYPEANVLVPREFDEESKTPAFKSVAVKVEAETR